LHSSYFFKPNKGKLQTKLFGLCEKTFRTGSKAGLSVVGKELVAKMHRNRNEVAKQGVSYEEDMAIDRKYIRL
jgi:hypothetical protein